MMSLKKKVNLNHREFTKEFKLKALAEGTPTTSVLTKLWGEPLGRTWRSRWPGKCTVSDIEDSDKLKQEY